eukprot:30497-Pelagococcus_subviridis.AAC.53
MSDGAERGGDVRRGASVPQREHRAVAIPHVRALVQQHARQGLHRYRQRRRGDGVHRHVRRVPVRRVAALRAGGAGGEFFLRGSQLFPRRRARLRLRGGDSGGGRRVCARGVRVLKSLQRQHRGLAHDLALVLARGPERFRALVRRDRPERLRGLVPHHAVVARVLKNLLQLRHRASGLHLTQRERDLVPEQRARVLQAVQQRVHGRVASDASQREERAEPPRDGHGRVKELRAEVRDAHLRRDRAATRAGIAVRSARARARSGGRRDVSLCQSSGKILEILRQFRAREAADPRTAG